jgi:hydrogenase maturation protein HypF
MIISELESQKFTVYYHRNIPANDGGLSLGQVTVAAARLEKEKME